MPKELHIVGVMSGSSLDGLDIALCKFKWNQQIEWEILNTSEVPIPKDIVLSLSQSISFLPKPLFDLHTQYGHWMGIQIRDFIKKTNRSVDAIAIHGHTVYHNPERQTTFQVGSSAQVAALTGLPCMGDFRTMDMAFGGQGAPLAHMADQYLFPGYEAYLNLGGIANLSLHLESWYSFDVCGANQVLNKIAGEAGKKYDDRGIMASKGKVFIPLLEKLKTHPYLLKNPPKSLDNQYTLQEFYMPFQRIHLSVEDKLATAVEWIALSITDAIKKHKNKDQNIKILVTGGGALNDFLIKRIQELAKDWLNLTLPDQTIIQFKEALLMSFLGALRLTNKSNCLGEVTGARKDTINGHIYLP